MKYSQGIFVGTAGLKMAIFRFTILLFVRRRKNTMAVNMPSNLILQFLRRK
jgi:hypothetical protein